MWNWPAREFKYTYFLWPDEHEYFIVTIADDVPLTKDNGAKGWEYIVVTLLPSAKDQAIRILEEEPPPKEKDTDRMKEKDIQELLLELARRECITWGEELKARIKCYNVIKSDLFSGDNWWKLYPNRDTFKWDLPTTLILKHYNPKNTEF